MRDLIHEKRVKDETNEPETPIFSMKTISLYRFLFLIGLACAFPGLAEAQSARNASAAAVEAKPTPFTLEIRDGQLMEGGKATQDATIGAIMEYLKKQNAYFSLALGPGVASVKVGDLILRLPEFEIASICQAISNCTAGAVSAVSVDGSGSWTLAMRESHDREVAVFNLTNYLNPDGKAEDKAIQDKLASVTDIIFKTLRDLDPTFSDSTQPHYQFHKGANLLVVTGSHQAMQVAGQVVSALTQPEAGSPAWANSMGGNSRGNLAGVVAHWADSDPAAALAWVNALPQSDPETTDMRNFLALADQMGRSVQFSPQLQKDIAELKNLANTYGPNNAKVRQLGLSVGAQLLALKPNIFGTPPAPPAPSAP